MVQSMTPVGTSDDICNAHISPITVNGNHIDTFHCSDKKLLMKRAMAKIRNPELLVKEIDCIIKYSQCHIHSPLINASSIVSLKDNNLTEYKHSICATILGMAVYHPYDKIYLTISEKEVNKLVINLFPVISAA